MKRKHVIIIILIIVVILIAISSWIVYDKYFKKPVQDVLPPNDPVSGEVIPPTGITQSFPLRKGMSGPMISEAQIAVNKKCNANLVPDGKFGPLTEAAISKCYGTGIVSESIYTQMKIDSTASNPCPTGQYKAPNGSCIPVAVKPAAVSTDLKKGDGVVSKVSELVLFSAPAGNTSIGKISNLTTSKQIGIYELKSGDNGEFSKLWLNLNYVKNNGLMGAAPAWVYVYTSLIKKK